MTYDQLLELTETLSYLVCLRAGGVVDNARTQDCIESVGNIMKSAIQDKVDGTYEEE